MTHPAYEQVRQLSASISVLLQCNPGPMTLDGTNTWLLSAPESDEVVVVDPGQGGDQHLDRLIEAAPNIGLVLVTHGHRDHSDTAEALHEATGAPTRAMADEFSFGASPLADGDTFEAAGLRLRVLRTPGHSSDSVSILVSSADGVAAAVLTGDTILGRGTSVVSPPDGHLGSYLASLSRLQDLGPILVLPGHGPEMPNLAEAASFYLAHRRERLDQVRAALDQLGPDATARQIVELVYSDVDRVLWPAAERSVLAQLEYLQEV